MKSVSLVIALYNQVDYTRRCIESILECTPRPYELILVDNASVDATADYVRGLSATVISNRTNLGCAKAWNQGIRASHGDVVGILNNDIVVTPGWIEKLLDFRERGAHGIVCPSAREGPLDYDLQAYAGEFAAACAQAVDDSQHLVAVTQAKGYRASVGYHDVMVSAEQGVVERNLARELPKRRHRAA